MSSRLMWVRVQIERESWVFISAYGPGSERSEEEIEEFWRELSECVGNFDTNESVVVLALVGEIKFIYLFGDLNARVRNEVI